VAQPVLLTIAVLVLTVLRWRGRQRADLRQSRRALGFAVCAVTLLILQAVLWFIFGFGEVFGGDVSGVIHLLPAVMTLALAALVFALPLEGGLVLIIVGGALTAYFSAAQFRSPAGSGGVMIISSGALVAGVPLLVAGILLLAATWLLRRDGGQPTAS